MTDAVTSPLGRVGNLTSNDVVEDTRVTGDSGSGAGRQNGQWVRAYPSKPGTFDCGSGNLATVKLNITI